METPVSGDTLRSVMRRVPSPVVVVTAAGAEETRGITIGSFTSVSLDPPLVCFNVNREARMHPVMTTASRFAVNIVTEEQVPLCRHFARPELTGAEQLEAIDYHLDEHGTPILDGVLAVLRCRPHARFEAGDHSIIVGKVVDTEVSNTGGAVLYYRRAYHGVGRALQSSVLAPVKRASSGIS